MQRRKHALPNRPGCLCIKIVSFQVLQSNLQAAIANAKNALVPSNQSAGITADEVQSAAVELQGTTESIVSDGLAESDRLVAEANQLSESLRNISTKVRLTHEFHSVTTLYGVARPDSHTFMINKHATTLFIVTLAYL